MVVKILRCSGCDFETSLVPEAEYAYVLEGGRHVDIPSEIMWCESCQTVRPCEKLPALSTLQNQLQSTDSPFNKSRLKALCDVLQQRRTPAKCLHCGSTNIKSLFVNRQRILHPNCLAGGRLEGHTSRKLVSLILHTELFSIEGERLAR